MGTQVNPLPPPGPEPGFEALALTASPEPLDLTARVNLPRTEPRGPGRDRQPEPDPAALDVTAKAPR
jgi:hypothetical protein